MNLNPSFPGDLQVITVREFIANHIRMFQDLPDVALARALVAVLEECMEAKRSSLATLIILAALMDIHGRAEEAIDLWSPLSAKLGMPVAVSRVGEERP